MKKLIVFFAMMFVAVNLYAATDGTFTVNGYAPAMYALTDTALDSFNRAIKNVPTEAKTFYVVGYADNTGDSIKNQDIGKNRAEEVGAEIKKNFPKAEVIIQTKGDSKNAREVMVSYDVSVVPAKKTNFSPLIFAGIAGALIMTVALVVLASKSKKKKPAVVRIEKNEDLETDWLVVESKGVVYKVFIEKRLNEEGVMMWHSKFRTAKDQPIRAKEKGQLLKNLKGPLWKPEFNFQKEALIKEEMILNA